MPFIKHVIGDGPIPSYGMTIGMPQGPLSLFFGPRTITTSGIPFNPTVSMII